MCLIYPSIYIFIYVRSLFYCFEAIGILVTLLHGFYVWRNFMTHLVFFSNHSALGASYWLYSSECLWHDSCMLCSSWGFSVIQYFVYLSPPREKGLWCMIKFRIRGSRQSHVHHIFDSLHVHTEKAYSFLANS